MKNLAQPRFVPLVARRYTHYGVKVHDHFLFVILEDDLLKWILEQEIIKL